MSDAIRKAVETYFAAWHEADAGRRAELIASCCTGDLRIRAPGQKVDGHAELDALIVDYQRRRPGSSGRLSSALEIHGNVFRFAAMIEGSPSVPDIEMLDVGECAEDGRIRLIFSFVGAAPPPVPA